MWSQLIANQSTRADGTGHSASADKIWTYHQMWHPKMAQPWSLWPFWSIWFGGVNEWRRGRKSNYATPKLWSYTLSVPIIHWTGQCVLQDERCFDFEYEIKFLMGENSRHGDGLGFNSGTEHFCLLSHMTSSMLIWFESHTDSEGDGPCQIHIQACHDKTVWFRREWRTCRATSSLLLLPDLNHHWMIKFSCSL